MAEKKDSKPTAKKKSVPATNDILGKIFKNNFGENEAWIQGINNLNSILDWDNVEPIKGKPFNKGVIGFRKYKNKLDLAIACGKAQVRYISLSKFISMIENMHDEESSTIMLQNFQSSEDKNSTAKGQILGRISQESSAILIIQGLTGRIIRNPSDFALFDAYHIDRAELTAYYIAAKTQIGNEDKLEEIISTFDGWKAFSVPLDPLNPYGE